MVVLSLAPVSIILTPIHRIHGRIVATIGWIPCAFYRNNPRIRKRLRLRGFVLTSWSSCRGPWRSAVSELAVAPSPRPAHRPRKPSRRVCGELRHATSRLRPDYTFFCSVPSGVGVRTNNVVPCPAIDRAAVLLIEIDFSSLSGPTQSFLLSAGRFGMPVGGFGLARYPMLLSPQRDSPRLGSNLMGFALIAFLVS